MSDKTLLIGIVEASVMHTDPNEFDLDTRFGMVKDAGVFDYFDKTPAPHLMWDYYKAIHTHGLPLTAGGFYYFLDRDEKLLDWNLRIAGDLGSRVHNVQIISHDLKGRLVTNEQVAEAYLQAAIGRLSTFFAEIGAPLLPQIFHPDRWLLWLGLMFILAVYFAPTGIYGRLRRVDD